MSKLFIPAGIPGCGKSTLATRVLNHTNLRIVEADAIRLEMTAEGLLEGVDDMSCNKEVFVRWHARIENHLLDGLDVYADATNLRDFAREKLRGIAERTGAETHLLVFTNPSVAVHRNLKRDRVVPPEAMVNMLEQYERALQDIPSETYSTVTYIEGTL